MGEMPNVEASQVVSERLLLRQQLEALLLLADEPLSLKELSKITTRPAAEVRDCVNLLQADYDGELDGPQRGFELRAIAGGYRLYVREHLDPLIRSGVREQAGQQLSQAALETLTVIAYQQPIARSEIANIRAVNVDAVVRKLLSRDLIAEVDRDPETGAARYGTTDTLLQHLGITGVHELPPISPLIEDHTADFLTEQK